MRLCKPTCRLSRWSSPAVALALIPILVLTTLPMTLGAAPQTKASPAGAYPSAGQAPLVAPTPRSVVVNRTLPKVGAPALRPVFSPQPSDAEIAQARVFEEPLVPIGRATSPQENKALALALARFLERGDNAETAVLVQFLQEHPGSPWRPALLTSLGMVYRKTGYFSKALEALEEAWRLAKNETDLKARALADRAVGELVDLAARLGHAERLAQILGELEGRELRGPATERRTTAREGLWRMRNESETAFLCGPYALSRVLAARQPASAAPARILETRVTRQGMSLAALAALAQRWGPNYRMAERRPGARLRLPAGCTGRWVTTAR